MDVDKTELKSLHNKKFVASFSGGKDSMLAIYRALKLGLLPLEILTTCPLDANSSWFHKISQHKLQQISDALNIPIRFVPSSAEKYNENFEQALKTSQKLGAEVVIFGDIDIVEHLEWGRSRCKAVGLRPFYPLWQENRTDLVKEFICTGFKAKIVKINHKRLQDGFLGEILSLPLLEKLIKSGVDVCGENGEYHTLVFDGPIFSHPINC